MKIVQVFAMSSLKILGLIPTEHLTTVSQTDGLESFIYNKIDDAITDLSLGDRLRFVDRD